MRLIPQNGKLAVRRQEAENRTAGGLYLPDQSLGKNEIVVVLATCPEWHDEQGNLRQSAYQPGDHLIASKYDGEEFDLDRGRLKVTLIRESAILAKIEIDDTDTHLPDARLIPKPAVALEVADGIDAPLAIDTLPDVVADDARLEAAIAEANAHAMASR